MQAQTKKLQPFTGAMIIESGIRYEELEIKIKDDLLSTADIPQQEDVVIRITKPWSFVTDASGKAYPGIGYTITDKKGKVLTSDHNIYKDDKTGINPNYLTALSFTIRLDQKTKLNDSLTIYTKFFDTKNNDSLLVILPCKVVAKGKAKLLDGWNRFSSTMGASGMFVHCKAERFSMKKTYSKNGVQNPVDTIKLSIDTLGNFIEKNGKVFLNALYILYDKHFNIVATQPLFENAEAGLTAAQLQGIKTHFLLPAGFSGGIARLLIEDKNGKGKLDAVLNFAY
jgi:hypothetical protein